MTAVGGASLKSLDYDRDHQDTLKLSTILKIYISLRKNRVSIVTKHFLDFIRTLLQPRLPEPVGIIFEFP